VSRVGTPPDRGTEGSEGQESTDGDKDVYVNMAAPSAAHSACTDRNTRWVSPILPTPGSYPLHPDAIGMAGMARVLEAAMTDGPNSR
jgi:hypothetical protein